MSIIMEPVNLEPQNRVVKFDNLSLLLSKSMETQQTKTDMSTHQTSSSSLTPVPDDNCTPVTGLLQEAELSQLAQLARDAAQAKLKNLPHEEDINNTELPKFEFSEIQLGRDLGRGQFGTVTEVRSLYLSRNSSNDPSRQLIQKQTIRKYGRKEGDSRYAIKVMQTKHMGDRDTYFTIYRDIYFEAQVLAALNHEHIVRVQGLCNERSAPGYFFLMDRLYETLVDRLEEWSLLQRKKMRNSSILFGPSKESEKDFFESRLFLVRDMASAVQYLHQNNVIHRDLKPHNLAFDHRGQIKLIDFGLCTTVPTQDKSFSGQQPSCFQLTARTGSLRYMAPENYWGKPYNHAIDIFALSMISWQVLTLESLYPKLDEETMVKMVIELGERPDFSHTRYISEELQALIRNMWSPDFALRPTADQVLDQIQTELDLRFDSVGAYLSERPNETDLDTSSRSAMSDKSSTNQFVPVNSLKRTSSVPCTSPISSSSVTRELHSDYLSLTNVKRRQKHDTRFKRYEMQKQHKEFLSQSHKDLFQSVKSKIKRRRSSQHECWEDKKPLLCDQDDLFYLMESSVIEFDCNFPEDLQESFISLHDTTNSLWIEPDPI